MAQPTLVEAYGAAAAVTLGVLSITLSQVYTSTPPASPTAESILVALLNKYFGVTDTGPDAEVIVTRTNPVAESIQGVNSVRQSYTVAIRQAVALNINTL
jgi:hypothetical protein